MRALLFTFLLVTMTLFSTAGQENTATPQRTPEQEAMKQTDKLQQELNLTPEQAKQIYDINLRYARERQISNKRSEAMERMKNKNAEIQQVLSQEQNEKLQSKRYERTNSELVNGVHPQSANQPTFLSNSELRPNTASIRTQGEVPVRSSFRPSNPTAGSTNQQPQAVRRTLPSGQTSQPQAPRTSNPAAVRPQIPSPTPAPPRSEPTPAAGNRR